MADADTIYRVLTVYNAETKQAESSVGGLAIVFDHLINLMERAGGMLEHVLELDSAAEKARISIGGMFNATDMPGAKDFQIALLESDAIIVRMKEHAAALPGEFSDLQEIFSRAIPGGSQANRSINQIEKLSGDLMAVSKTFGIQTEFAGREFAEMMEGRASSRVTLFQKLRQFMGEGMDAQKFNALSAPEKWEQIEKALSHFGPMIAEYGNSWDAISSTTSQYVQELVKLGSGGVFVGLKKELFEINAWYEAHKQQVDDLAKRLGEGLGGALARGLEIAKQAVSFMIEHQDALLKIGEAFVLVKGFQMMGGGFGGAGGLAGSQQLSFANVLGGGAFGMALGHATGNATLFGSALFMAEGALGTLPGTVGMVSKSLLAFHAALQYGADKWDAYTNKKFEREDNLLSLVDNINHNRDVGALFSRAKEMGAIDKNTLDFNAVKFKAGLEAMGATPDLALSATRTAILEMNRMDRYDRAKRMGLVPGIEAETPEMLAKRKLDEQSRAAHKSDTNIYLHVEQTLHDADDPERVYISTIRAVRDGLTRKAVSPKGMVLR